MRPNLADRRPFQTISPIHFRLKLIPRDTFRLLGSSLKSLHVGHLQCNLFVDFMKFARGHFLSLEELEVEINTLERHGQRWNRVVDWFEWGALLGFPKLSAVTLTVPSHVAGTRLLNLSFERFKPVFRHEPSRLRKVVFRWPCPKENNNPDFYSVDGFSQFELSFTDFGVKEFQTLIGAAKIHRRHKLLAQE